MVMRRQLQQRGAGTRELVLKTALNLFTTKGYFNTSIHDIRRSADVSIGSIYHYFGSKEAIAKALYDDVLERMDKAVAGMIVTNTTARDRCRAILAFLLETAERDPETMQFMLHARHKEFMPEEKPICSARPFENMRLIVEQGIKNGEIRSIDPWVAAASIFGGSVRMIQLKLDGAIDAPLTEYLDELWQCAWDSVAP